MTTNYNYYVDYNHAADASTITWTHEEKKIDACKSFIDFIRCDENGEEYQFLYSDDEVEVVLGFKDKDGVILEDCFEENSNRTIKLCKIEG